MKQTFTFLLFLCFTLAGNSQTLFSENFNGTTLTSGAAKLPNNWVIENRDGQSAIANPANYPFNQPAYLNDAWALTDINLNGEISVISTSLHGPLENVTDRWLISPKVAGIKATSFLFWKGFTDNLEALDNCEVWVTTTIAGSEPSSADFLVDNANKIKSFKMKPDEFNTYAVSLGDFEGKDIYFAFRNLSFRPAKSILDDFEIKDALENDIAVKALTMDTYILSGTTPISAEIVSVSRNPITSVTLKYEVVGSGVVKTETFAINLPTISSATTVSFATNAELLEGGHDIRVWVDKVNGQADMNEENNQKEGFVSAINDPPLKKVLIQEYTGAWCGWCPAGAYILEELTIGDPTLVPVSLHSGDKMDVEEAQVIINSAVAGYPSASFDFQRFPGENSIGVSRTQWFDRTFERLDAIVPVELKVDHTYDRNTRDLEITIESKFLGAVKDELRLNVWIIENDVSGPLNAVGNNGWNNANYEDADPTSPFYGLGPYLEPDEFRHENVLNAILTGSWGESVYPFEITAGQSFSNTYNFTLPQAAGAERHWKAEDIHVIAFVSHYELSPRKRYVLNAASGKTFLVGVEEPSIEALSGVSLSPNPVIDHAVLSLDLSKGTALQISIFNQLGQEVSKPIQATYPVGRSNQNLNFESLPNGVYFVNLLDETGGVHTQRVVLQR